MSLRCPACGSAEYVAEELDPHEQDIVGELIQYDCLDCEIEMSEHLIKHLRESHAKLLEACKNMANDADQALYSHLRSDLRMLRDSINSANAAIAFAEPQEPIR
jgi:hypothetical protein